jgi:phosphoserine phosphatase RsbU/P
MSRPFTYLRINLTRVGLWPTTRIARFTCYLVAIDLVFIAIRSVLRLFRSASSEFLSGWITLLTIVATVFLVVLSYRWLKAKLLWRLRNRLIVTYVFIGVIPTVLLVTITFVTMYLFAGQFASFLVTAQMQSRLRNLASVNSAIASQLAAQVEHNQPLNTESLASLRRRDPLSAPRQFCAWDNGKPLPVCTGETTAKPLTAPAFLNGRLDGVIRDGGELSLRSSDVVKVKDHTLVVISSEPLDRPMMEKVAANLGEVTLYTLVPGVVVPKNTRNGQASVSVEPANQPGISIHTGAGGTVMESGNESLRPILTAGMMPAATGRLDREITFGTPLSVVDWETGQTHDVGALVRVQTRPAALYTSLFAFSDFAKSIEYALIFLAIVFAVIVLIALIIGTHLTRTITRAVAQLYLATRHINRGDFSHRIPVKSQDQLSTLATSFNSMAESLQKLIEEQKEKQRLENELIIAQEVQAQLFPRQISQLSSLEVHGVCRPARTVSGDYYDFLTVDPHRMVMAVGDVSGKGISAALLMATIHSAVRAYSLEGIPILRDSMERGNGKANVAVHGVEVSTAALLKLLNLQLYESTPAEKYATLFLGFYDGRERKLTYSNAGHLPPVVLGHNAGMRRLECGGTVVGLFNQANYEESTVQLSDGEIFIAYSDGVTEPENDFGEFGEERLVELVWQNRQLPLAKISEVVTTAVDDWIGAKEQPDDITLVLARAR